MVAQINTMLCSIYFPMLSKKLNWNRMHNNFHLANLTQKEAPKNLSINKKPQQTNQEKTPKTNQTKQKYPQKVFLQAHKDSDTVTRHIRKITV